MNDDDKRWWAELQQKYAEDFLDPEGHAPEEIHVPVSMGQTHKVDALHGEGVELLRKYIQEATMKKCKKHGKMSVCEQCGQCCDCKMCKCGNAGGQLLKMFINEAVIDEDEEEDELPEADEANVVANIAGYTGPLGMGSPPYVGSSGSAKKGTPPWNKRGPSKGKRRKKKKQLNPLEPVRLTCCETGSWAVTWRQANTLNGPSNNGWCIIIHVFLGAPSYENVDFCPFCKKKLHDTISG